MINPTQYARLVLEPALKACDLYSIDAMYLMMRTAMVESKITHLKQLPDGPALGIMQIEPQTYLDVHRYLTNKTGLQDKILSHCHLLSFPGNTQPLIHNLAFNALIGRIKYWMVPEPLPYYSNIDGQADYWKRHYNTYDGKGKVEDFIKSASLIDI